MDNSTITRAIAELIREGRDLKYDDRTVAEKILAELARMDVFLENA